MASRYSIKLNQEIRVSNAGGKEDWYVSTVQDIRESEFFITIPFREGLPLILKKGDFVKISFEGAAAKVVFETVVTGWQSTGIPLYIVAMQEEEEEETPIQPQQRGNVRFPVVLDVYYSEISQSNVAPSFKKGSTQDLSVGGTKIVTNKDFPVDTLLMIKFDVPINNRNHEIEVLAKVARTWVSQDGKSFQVALEYTNVSRAQQDLIFRFIFNRMIEQRSRR